MQVSSIGNNQLSNPRFGEFKVQKSVLKHLTNHELEQVKTWQNQLANTKYFDLVVGKSLDRIAISINQKASPYNVMYGVLKLDALQGNKIKAHGNDGLDIQDSIKFMLEYPTRSRAKEVYEGLKPENNPYPVNHPFNKISRAVDSVKALEEAYDYFGNKPSESFITKVMKLFK